MSLTRTRFVTDVLLPAAHEPDMDIARSAFDPSNARAQHASEFAVKAADIGSLIVEQLTGLGTRPNFPPVLSEVEELDAFLEAFGVSRLHKLADSVPVRLSGCSVQIDEVMKWSDLSEAERARIPHMYDCMPAVRVHFVPNEV